MLTLMKKITCIMLVLLALWQTMFVSAQNGADDPFVLIPEAKDSQTAGNDAWNLWNKWASGEFRELYNESAEWMNDDVWWQLASGIMNRDTILLILGRVVTFLANGALVVWSWMIIYAWYLYVLSVFAGDYTSQANEAIKWAIIGIVIVIFAYAILRLVIHAFL